MATNTYSGLTAEQKTFYNRTLLSRLTPNLFYAKYGQKKPLPKNEGDTVNFRRFNSLAPATTPLTEGTTPEGSSLSVTAVTAKVNQYGDFVAISDKLDLAGIDPVLTESAQVLGEAAALTVDSIVRDEIVNGTNVVYAGGKTSNSALTAEDVLTGNDVKKAVRTLRKADAKPASGEYYIGIIDPDVAFDLMNDPLWQDVSKYNGGEKIMKGEVGKLHGVKFVTTTNTKVAKGGSGSSVDVHSVIIIGKDAYGIVDLEGGSNAKMIVKGFGSAGTADPLDQRATAGYKLFFTAKRLQELALCRIECAASA